MSKEFRFHDSKNVQSVMQLEIFRTAGSLLVSAYHSFIVGYFAHLLNIRKQGAHKDHKPIINIL